MYNIIITGASGLVATELAYNLLRNTDAHLFLLSTHPEKIKERYMRFIARVECFTLESFSAFVVAKNVKFDCCFHTAFARSAEGHLIVESITYQRKFLEILKDLDLDVFVNISSQSVYGKTSIPLWKENTSLDPDNLYAMGKYFSEVVTKDMLDGTGIRWTNLRLCSVCENARFVRIFLQNVIEGKPIVLTSPDQQCSFIEIQDVADALVAFVCQIGKIELKPVYNLGANIVDTIEGVACKVKNIAEECYGMKNVQIVKMSSDNHIHIGMDASLFMETFGWRPRRSMRDMLTEMFEMLMNGDNRVIPISFKIVYGYEFAAY